MFYSAVLIQRGESSVMSRVHNAVNAAVSPHAMFLYILPRL